MGRIYHRPPTVGLNRDSNEAPIRMAMAEAGATVFSVGWPFDLLVRWGDEWIAVEVKNPETRHRLTAIQKAVDELGCGSLRVVRTVEEALGVLHGRQVSDD